MSVGCIIIKCSRVLDIQKSRQQAALGKLISKHGGAQHYASVPGQNWRGECLSPNRFPVPGLMDPPPKKKTNNRTGTPEKSQASCLGRQGKGWHLHFRYLSLGTYLAHPPPNTLVSLDSRRLLKGRCSVSFTHLALRQRKYLAHGRC